MFAVGASTIKECPELRHSMIILENIHMSLNNFRLDSIGHILITSVVSLWKRTHCHPPLLPPRWQVPALGFFLIGEKIARSVENHFWWFLLLCNILFHFPTPLFIRPVCINSIAACDRESCAALAHTAQNIYSPRSSIVM